VIDQSYTIDEFCKAERISRAFLYKLWSQRTGPRFYYVGSVRRISQEARLEWQRKSEAAAKCGQAAHRGKIPTSRIGKPILKRWSAPERTLEGSR
jgi:hypothetical protein